MIKRMLWGLIVVLLWAMPVWAQDYRAARDYKIAVQRIEEEAAKGAVGIGFMDLVLEEIPPELFEKFPHIQALSITGYQGKQLPPEFFQLKNLEYLYLVASNLTSLSPEIRHLTKLQTLKLVAPNVKSLPAEIGELRNLRYLLLNLIPLTYLPSEIGQLSELQELQVFNAPLTHLPVEIGNLNNLRTFHFLNTPIVFPPPEIQKQGTQAMLSYLRSQQTLLAHQARQTIAGIAAGIGAIAAVLLAFRWRQRRGLGEKKKRA